MWDNRQLNPLFYLPESNRFICTNFEILHKPDDADAVEPPAYPEKIFENECCELWYRLDDKFLLPHAFINMLFVSPLPLQSAFKYALKIDSFIQTILSYLFSFFFQFRSYEPFFNDNKTSSC